MRVARLVSTLVLTAHGSADPRSSATTYAVAERIRALRPGLDVRAAFCEQTAPNLRDVLCGLAREGRRDAVVTPLLLANAYHARVDIPGLIADSDALVRQGDVLGEDERLVQVMRERLAEVGVSPTDGEVGVLVVAVGSSYAAANARTGHVAAALAAGTHWVGAVAAFATGPRPTVNEAARRLRAAGARRLVVAPWFLADGRITDGVADYARGAGIAMAEPLGAHTLVAATVLDRFDDAVLRRVAA
jgi:sirohydrochlorin ferrochelatase